jgi:group I intron endonuclease
MATEPRSGIYEIVNTINGKRYVGSAVAISQRWRQHRCELAKGRHNPHLQSAWRKYGAEAFEFRVLELVSDPAKLIEREQHYIDTLNPEYKVARVAGSNLGVKWSDETRARMGEASRRVWSCPEHRQRMSEAHKGQRATPEQRAKASEVMTGRTLSPEHRASVAARNAERNASLEHRAKVSAHFKGRPKTAEQIAKMAASKRGKPAHNKGAPPTAEQRAKQSATMRARYQSDPASRKAISAATRAAMNTPEMRQRLSEAARGRTHDEETRRKMSESHKLAWARRKAAAPSE